MSAGVLSANTGITLFGLPFQSRSTKTHWYVKLSFGDPHIHYEWQLRKRRSVIGVALHFEHDKQEDNFRLLELVSAASGGITEGMHWEFEAMPWGKRWAQVHFLIPYGENTPPTGIAPIAASTMKTLIERTWGLLNEQVKARAEFLEFFPEAVHNAGSQPVENDEALFKKRTEVQLSSIVSRVNMLLVLLSSVQFNWRILDINGEHQHPDEQ